MSIPGTFDQWLRAVKQVGLPTCVCGVILWAVWPMFGEQVAIMKSAREGIERNSETSMINAQSLAKLTSCQEQQGKILNRVCRVLERVEQAVGLPDKNDNPLVVKPRAEHQEPEL